MASGRSDWLKRLFLSSRRRHTRCALVTGVQTCALPICDEDGVAAGLHCASPWGGEKAKYSYTLQKKVGTPKCHSYPNERIGFSAMPSPEKIAYDPDAPVDPRVETLVNELIGRVADKWTLLVLEELEDHGTCRFTELSRLVPGISQKRSAEQTSESRT